MNSSVGFRCCHGTDLAVCASIVTESFPPKISRSTGEEASEFVQFKIVSCHAISNYREPPLWFQKWQDCSSGDSTGSLS